MVTVAVHGSRHTACLTGAVNKQVFQQDLNTHGTSVYKCPYTRDIPQGEWRWIDMAFAIKDTQDGIRLTQAPAIPRENMLERVDHEDIFASVIAEANAARESKQESASTDGPRDNLMHEDISNIAAVLGHEVSVNTRKNYLSQWRRFSEWAEGRRIRALPADPLQIAAYLAERLVKHGHKPATLQAAVAAIGFLHRREGFFDPCEATEVKDMLSSARRMAGSDQRQAKGITYDELKIISESAILPRRWSDGRMESVDVAERRGRVDIALISTMRDALLRVSEAAALRWEDIEEEEDGTGRLYIRRSKTDVEGEGAVAFLSVQTMESLDDIRGMSLGDYSVFGLMPNGISRRIEKSARAAGLGEGYSGHSPRVGMARDLARAGTELTRLMTAGRWRSPRMPALYTRNETVARGAVAQYYGSRRRVHPGELKEKDDTRPGKGTTGDGHGDTAAQFNVGEYHLLNWECGDGMQQPSNQWTQSGSTPMVAGACIRALIHAE
jgi:integrase